MMPQVTTKRPWRAVVPLNSNTLTASKPRYPVGGKSRKPGQVTNMKYTYEISQWDVNIGYPMIIFCDLDAEAFEQHSTMARWWLPQHHPPMEYISPARRNLRIHFNIFLGDPFMHPNALKYVFCAINRARHGKKIFLDLPNDFALSVQIHQVLIFLQVEECIDPMHGHIRQIIRERPLLPVEFNVLWLCLGIYAPKIYEFALSMYYERQKCGCSSSPSIETTRPSYEIVIHNAEKKVSKRETLVNQDAERDIQIFSKDITTYPNLITHYAENEDHGQEDKELATIIHQPTRIMHARRHSLPIPYSEPMYDIDTSAFLECDDEGPE
jgi:hypothetical protein